MDTVTALELVKQNEERISRDLRERKLKDALENMPALVPPSELQMSDKGEVYLMVGHMHVWHVRGNIWMCGGENKDFYAAIKRALDIQGVIYEQEE